MTTFSGWAQAEATVVCIMVLAPQLEIDVTMLHYLLEHSSYAAWSMGSTTSV